MPGTRDTPDRGAKSDYDPHGLGAVPETDPVDPADAVERLDKTPEGQKNFTDPDRDPTD